MEECKAHGAWAAIHVKGDLSAIFEFAVVRGLVEANPIPSLRGLVHVPYKGGAEYFQALLGGQIESLFGTYLEAAPHLKSGKLRALAVTSASRHPQLPDVPAVSETLAGFDAVGWFGFLAPKGTPQPVIDRLHSEIAAATRDPGVRARMAELGFVPQLTTPTEFGERIRADLTKWGGLVRTPGVVLN